LNFDLAIREGWGGREGAELLHDPVAPSSLSPSLPPSLFVFLSQPGFKAKKFGTQ